MVTKEKPYFRVEKSIELFLREFSPFGEGGKSAGSL